MYMWMQVYLGCTVWYNLEWVIYRLVSQYDFFMNDTRHFPLVYCRLVEETTFPGKLATRQILLCFSLCWSLVIHTTHGGMSTRRRDSSNSLSSHQRQNSWQLWSQGTIPMTVNSSSRVPRNLSWPDAVTCLGEAEKLSQFPRRTGMRFTRVWSNKCRKMDCASCVLHLENFQVLYCVSICLSLVKLGWVNPFTPTKLKKYILPTF